MGLVLSQLRASVVCVGKLRCVCLLHVCAHPFTFPLHLGCADCQSWLFSGSFLVFVNLQFFIVEAVLFCSTIRLGSDEGRKGVVAEKREVVEGEVKDRGAAAVERRVAE